MSLVGDLTSGALAPSHQSFPLRHHPLRYCRPLSAAADLHSRRRHGPRLYMWCIEAARLSTLSSAYDMSSTLHLSSAFLCVAGHPSTQNVSALVEGVLSPELHARDWAPLLRRRSHSCFAILAHDVLEMENHGKTRKDAGKDRDRIGEFLNESGPELGQTSM